MNISKLATATGVSAYTLRYYEKEGILSSPMRGENGYRCYGEEHLARVRFVRSAQALGFSLAEIRQIIPQLSAGTFGRTEIEQQLKIKLAEIDQHMQQLRTLKKQLQATFAELTCARDEPVAITGATRAGSAEMSPTGHLLRRH